MLAGVFRTLPLATMPNEFVSTRATFRERDRWWLFGLALQTSGTNGLPPMVWLNMGWTSLMSGLTLPVLCFSRVHLL